MLQQCCHGLLLVLQQLRLQLLLWHWALQKQQQLGTVLAAAVRAAAAAAVQEAAVGELQSKSLMMLSQGC
jgi:hypothetical protein